jgi:hypothetical protein
MSLQGAGQHRYAHVVRRGMAIFQSRIDEVTGVHTIETGKANTGFYGGVERNSAGSVAASQAVHHHHGDAVAGELVLDFAIDGVANFATAWFVPWTGSADCDHVARVTYTTSEHGTLGWTCASIAVSTALSPLYLRG